MKRVKARKEEVGNVKVEGSKVEKEKSDEEAGDKVYVKDSREMKKVMKSVKEDIMRELKEVKESVEVNG